MKGA
jgi:hypothetical protein